MACAVSNEVALLDAGPAVSADDGVVTRTHGMAAILKTTTLLSRSRSSVVEVVTVNCSAGTDTGTRTMVDGGGTVG